MLQPIAWHARNTAHKIGLDARKGAGHGVPPLTPTQQQGPVDGVEGWTLPGVLRPQDKERWPGGEQGHRLAARRRDLPAPGPGGVDEVVTPDARAPLGADGKSRGGTLNALNLGVLDELRARAQRQAGDDRGDAPRLGHGIALRPGGAAHQA